MSSGDRTSFFIGVGAIVVTLGVGTCSTNARFNDMNARFDDVNAHIDDVQADIRELRALVIDALKRGESADEPAALVGCLAAHAGCIAARMQRGFATGSYSRVYS